MKKLITYSLVWIALLGLCMPIASGQGTSAETAGKKKFLRMRLLPVGDFPVSGAVIKNNLPVIIVPPPSELVPTPVFVKDGKTYKSLNLTLNSPSATWRRPMGSVVNVLTQKDGQYNNYVSITLPEEHEDITIFMLRNSHNHSWTSTPQTRVFKNGIQSFPLGGVRVINFSSVPLQANIGQAKYVVPPQRFTIVNNPGTDGNEIYFTYSIAANVQGRNYQLANTAVAYDKQSRINLVAYDRDGKSVIRQEGDDRPVKIVSFFELPYQPPPDPNAPEPPPNPPARTATNA